MTHVRQELALDLAGLLRIGTGTFEVAFASPGLGDVRVNNDRATLVRWLLVDLHPYLTKAVNRAGLQAGPPHVHPAGNTFGDPCLGGHAFQIDGAAFDDRVDE